jgi:hypothetical protein
MAANEFDFPERSENGEVQYPTKLKQWSKLLL